MNNVREITSAKSFQGCDCEELAWWCSSLARRKNITEKDIDDSIKKVRLAIAENRYPSSCLPQFQELTREEGQELFDDLAGKNAEDN